MKAGRARQWWILFVISAVIMLPAAFTNVAMQLGVSEYTLLWNRLLTGLMLLPVMLRCFFVPHILCVLNGIYLICTGVRAWRQRTLCKEMGIGLVTLLILLISFPGLEMFFWALMGI